MHAISEFNSLCCAILCMRPLANTVHHINGLVVPVVRITGLRPSTSRIRMAVLSDCVSACAVRLVLSELALEH